MLAARRPFDRIDAFVVAPAARENVPAALRPPPRVDRQHHRLRAEFLRQFTNQFGPAHRGRVDADLIGPRVQYAPRVIDRADAAADRQRDENFTGGARDYLHHGVAVVARRRDVQKHQLVGALLVVARREFHRISRVAQVHEIDALDHASLGDVETGDDALGQHAQLSTKFLTMRSPRSPDFSG